MPSYEAMPKARSAALAAIELDPALAAAHAPLILVAFVHDWDWTLAERIYHRAITLDERLVGAHSWHSLHLGCHGRFDESIAAARRAVEIDPLAAASYSTLGTAYMNARRFDEAIAAARRAVELDPQLWIAERMGCISLLELGRAEEATARLEHMVSLSNRHHWALEDLAHAFMAVGRTSDARMLCDEILERARGSYVPPTVVAIALGMLDRTEEMSEWLERAYRERDSLPIWNYWPASGRTFKGHRTAEMMRRVGLTPNPRLAA
jgi:tetratricopeptide (TPR) repeat protein